MRYGKTYTRVHDPLVWREVADALLRESGRAACCSTRTVTEVLVEGDRVVGVRRYTKQGKLEIRARITIDASGDGDIAAMAGLQTFMGDDGKVQNPTMIFRMHRRRRRAFPRRLR